jgi:hypothetical protein
LTYNGNCYVNAKLNNLVPFDYHISTSITLDMYVHEELDIRDLDVM